MRRLVLLVCAIVLVDTMLFAALVPLLPGYAEEFGLSKAEAGLLVAAFALGALGGALPSGLATARVGAKQTVVVGIVLMSLASLGFGFAADVWTLGVARFFQGFGSALAWTGGFAWLVAATPRERRGETLGTAIGAAVVGALLGPVLGGAAGVVGTDVLFTAVAVVGALLAAAALRMPRVAAEPEPLRALLPALRAHDFLASLWLTLLPALLFGVLVVLVPLELGRLGWEGPAIAAVFLAATSLEAMLAPVLGRLSDRRGRLVPVRGALVASAVVSLALAAAGGSLALVALTVVAAGAYGAFYVPASALVSDASERLGLSQGVGFALSNAAWGAGTLAGPSAGGALAELAGDAVPFVAVAATCLVTLAVLERARPSGTLRPRVPETR